MRILIADNHALVRELLGAYLENMGSARVVTAKSLHEALDFCQTAGPFDLALLDYDMPDMNGLAGLETALKANLARGIAILSINAHKSIVQGAIQKGAIGFLTKVMTASDFLKAVNTMVFDEVFVPLEFTPEDEVVKGLIKILSKREREVLNCISQGLSNKEIARELGLQEVTIKLHVRTLCRKLAAKNRTQAAMIAKEAGLV